MGRLDGSEIETSFNNRKYKTKQVDRQFDGTLKKKRDLKIGNIIQKSRSRIMGLFQSIGLKNMNLVSWLKKHHQQNQTTLKE